ncbi:hypothetical protein Tco_1563546 [Tanacetum coccineum]
MAKKMRVGSGSRKGEGEVPSRIKESERVKGDYQNQKGQGVEKQDSNLLISWINQGRSAKRRKSESAVLGQLNLPPKDDDHKVQRNSLGSEYICFTKTTFLAITSYCVKDISKGSGGHRYRSTSLVLGSNHYEGSSSKGLLWLRTGKKKSAKLFLKVTPKGRQSNSAYCIMKNPLHLRRTPGSDLFLLNIQEKLNHLPKTDKTSLYTAVNMWDKGITWCQGMWGRLAARDESFKQKSNLNVPNVGWMQLDGTLTRFMEKLDHMVKDFHLYGSTKVHGGIGSGQRMTRRRSKDFNLRSRKDYRSGGSFELECFVRGKNKRY